jgi:hypothetical protein
MDDARGVGEPLNERNHDGTGMTYFDVYFNFLS